MTAADDAVTEAAQRCPVCGGKGIVPNGFYASTERSWSGTSLTPDKCRSCRGTGLVWSRLTVPVPADSEGDGDHGR